MEPKDKVAQAMFRRATIYELLLGIGKSLLSHEDREDLEGHTFDGHIPEDLTINIEFFKECRDGNYNRVLMITAKSDSDGFGKHLAMKAGETNREAIAKVLDILEKRCESEGDTYTRFVLDNWDKENKCWVD